MITIDIPGYKVVRLEHLVLDYSGTLSLDGQLLRGIAGRFNELSKILDIHILTADTHGKALGQLKDIKCTARVLTGDRIDVQKEEYINNLGPRKVAAVGNGNNDRRLLAAAEIGVIVCLEEGCSIETLNAADVMVKSAADALDLFLYPDRLKATLRI